MAEPFDYWIVANEASASGPALSGGPHPWVAWKDADGDFPCIMPIARRPDGSVYFDTTRKKFVDNTAVGGGIALSSIDDDHTAVVWSHDHDPAELFGNVVDGDGDPVGDLVALGQSSQFGPALCYWIRELNMAWTGEDQRLNVAPFAGADLAFDRKFTSDETSEYEPALAWRPAPNRLYMAWTGEGDGTLNIMYSQGGAWGDPQPYIAFFDRATKREFRTETSEAGPGLLVTGPGARLVYRGSGNNNITELFVDVDSGEIGRKRISGHTTPHQPAISRFFDAHWVAYTGDDDRLYLAHLAR